MNGLCSRLTFFPPPKNNRVLLSGPWYQMKHMYYNTKCTILHIYTWECLPCGGYGVHATLDFFPPHIIVDSGKYLMWHLWCLQIFILTPKCSHSVKLQHLVILVAATELTSCWHQADYTLHTYWNHSFSHFVYILLADLAESSKDLLSQLLSHFYPLEIKQTNHNRESGWHFSLLFFISMAQEGRCQMSVHNYYQAL